MTESEFKALRDLPGKQIEGDIVFAKNKNTSPMLVFSDIFVENSTGNKVRVNGKYHPGVPLVGFNFVLEGYGPICRLEINADNHEDAGRTHKHELTDDGLTLCYHAKEFAGMEDTPVEAWRKLCGLANIVHNGKMLIP